MRVTSSFSIVAASLAVLLCFSSAANATILVNLDAGDAVYDGGATTNFTIATPTLADGLTFNITFTPSVADLSGTSVLMQIGGEGSGTGLYLLDGVPFVALKMGSAGATVPVAGDLSMSNGSVLAVSGFAALTAGVETQIAVIFDPFDTLTMAVGDVVSNDVYNLTDVTGSNTNWSGNESFTVGNAASNAGGLTNSGTGPYRNSNAGSLTGTVSQALYWNDVGALNAVPEPSTLVFAALGLLGLGLFNGRRRK